MDRKSSSRHRSQALAAGTPEYNLSINVANAGMVVPHLYMDRLQHHARLWRDHVQRLLSRAEEEEVAVEATRVLEPDSWHTKSAKRLAIQREHVEVGAKSGDTQRVVQYCKCPDGRIFIATVVQRGKADL